MKKLILSLCVLLTPFSILIADDHISIAAKDAAVYFIQPIDGQTLSAPVTVRFGLSGMGVAPAGVKKQNTGHHHLLINLEKLPDLSKPLPANEHVRHFGGGQTEVVLDLPKGEHRLQLLLGDHHHIPHQQAVMSEVITITVR
ncbi:MAG: DUF4399 domain-containing protein [Gammaproteobacteria bacterium]|nr:DUF4399 domain-containing protein [Gammaproteobacteria bacterium]